MSLVLFGRIAAIIMSVSTFGFLFVHDSWRSDNLFLVPDLVLCAALLVAAGLPQRLAPAALAVAFAYSAGVLATSVASYAVRDELGAPSLFGAVVAVVLAVVLVRRSDPAPRH